MASLRLWHRDLYRPVDPSVVATMSVDAAAGSLGISRTHAYDLVPAGEIPHLKLGRRIVNPRTRARRDDDPGCEQALLTVE